MSRPIRPLVERFWEKVDKHTTPDGCWTWTACVGSGYGYLGVGHKRVKAAIISWELTNGKKFPEGKLVCHRCNNRICVRPDHLYAGDLISNYKDRVVDGVDGLIYYKTGEEHPKAVLTWEQVREIRNLYSNKEGFYRKATVSQRSLAKQFGVSRRTIRAALSHISWKEKYNKEGQK